MDRIDCQAERMKYQFQCEIVGSYQLILIYEISICELRQHQSLMV